ncbi:MAG: hypothetical protein DMD40_14930 [Gemmatimonadetes bacterium]|nr:MAG: hypothetical protein DMD40_14930 [Gemmatimonadota bacterium]
MVGTLFLPLLTLTQTLDSTYDRRALWLAHGPGATGVVQGMGTQAASVGGGTFIPGTDLFETATDRIRSEYGASRAGFKRFTVFGGLQIAGMLATMSYYGGRHHPKWKPGFGIGLPVATFAVGWVGQANAIRGEDHLRRAMWWYNREFPRSVTDSARANCSYDRCALRIRPRVSSHQLVQGVAELPVGSADSQLELFAAAVLYAASRNKVVRGFSYGLLVLSYGAGHSTVYGAAQAESELDQAIWFYNRSLP